MPDGQKVVAMPTGERIGFPATMQDSEINNVLSNWVPGSGMAPQSPVAPLPKEMQPVQSYGNYGGQFHPSMVPANIEQAGQAEDVRKSNLIGREQKAGQSPTPFTNAASILEPVTAARQIVGGKLGGYAGNKIKPGGTGELLGGLLGSLLAGKANEPDLLRQGAQQTLGVGSGFIQQGAEKIGEENAELVGKHQQRVETIQKANAESQQGFSQRQHHLDIADQHAQAIADQLPSLHQSARAEARAAYGPDPAGKFDPTELKSAIEDTAKSKLQGNTALPAAVAKIIKDIDKPPEPSMLDQASVFRGAGRQMRGGGIQSASDAISVMEPRARAKYLESLSPEERAQFENPSSASEGQTPTDATRLHGFMSELGRAGRSGSLAPDEASAINATRAMIEGRLRKMYESENRLGDFQAGQAKWKQMANTFENSSSPAKGGSPIAQALQTKDPVTGKLRPDYVQAALSGDKSYPVSQEMLNRYKHLGAPVNELEVMKTHGDFADTLPKQVKWRTEPDEPNLSEFDPIEARKVALKQKGQNLSGTGGPYGVMRDVMGVLGLFKGNPMALSYPVLRRVLGSEVGSEKLINWLSKSTPEEMDLAKEIPAKKVALKRANQR